MAMARMNTLSIELELRELVTRRGGRLLIPRRGGTRSKYTWNGKTLAPNVDTYEDLAHDVAHLMIAAVRSKRELSAIEFGLGPDPANMSSAKAIYKSGKCDRIEADACDVNVCLCQLLGLSALHTSNYLNTPYPSMSIVRRLRKKYEKIFTKSQWRTLEVAARDDSWYRTKATAIRSYR